MTISTDNQQSRLASLPSLQQLKMATSVAKLFMYGALVASVSVLALATSRIVSTSPAKMLSRIFKSTGKADGITAVSAIDKSIRSSDERRQAALLGMYVADAVAMPVHWMYNLGQLKKDYGVIRSFVKPKDRFDGSIMNLSNTGGGGRGSDQGDIVGSVILHGKKKFWLRGGNFHYHLGLDAGENTLEAQLCRLLTQSILETSLSTPPNSDAPEPAPAPAFKPSHFTEKYMTFMQTPGSHNDTYASTAHRMFFANLVQGKAPSECADNDGHNTDAIDALTLTVPVIIAYADAPRNLRNTKIREVIAITRKSRVLQSYAETYSDILIAGTVHVQSILCSISCIAALYNIFCFLSCNCWKVL